VQLIPFFSSKNKIRAYNASIHLSNFKKNKLIWLFLAALMIRTKKMSSVTFQGVGVRVNLSQRVIPHIVIPFAFGSFRTVHRDTDGLKRLRMNIGKLWGSQGNVTKSKKTV